MKTLLIAAALVCLAGCGIPPNWGAPGTTPPWEKDSRFNGKDYPDPHPESASNDAQRAAYEAHQREQVQQSHDSGPDLSQMHCTTTSSGSSGPNAGTMTSSTSCHN